MQGISTTTLLTIALFPGAEARGAAHQIPSSAAVPVSFELNRGQTDPSVRYLGRGRGTLAFLVNDGVILQTRSGPVRMRFDGARHAYVSASGELPGSVRYVYGGRELQTKTFASVRYTGLYRGVDLLFYGNADKLEYDFSGRRARGSVCNKNAL